MAPNATLAEKNEESAVEAVVRVPGHPGSATYTDEDSLSLPGTR